MYNYVRQHCTACAQVIAGDFGSGASAHPGQTFSRGQKLGDYLRVYYRNLRDAKDVTDWGLHPYGDVEYAQKLWWDRRHGKGGPAVPAPSGTRVYSFAAALKQLSPRNSTKIHIAYHVWEKSKPTPQTEGTRIVRVATVTWPGGKPHVS